MKTLCIASPEGQVGKTAVCSGIAKKLQSDGKRVGYFKPVSVTRDGISSGLGDCEFLNEVLELGKPAHELCPVVIGRNELAAAAKRLSDITKKVQEAYREASTDMDVMVIEGPAGLARGSVTTALLGAILDAIPAKLVVVLEYLGRPLQPEFDAMDPDIRRRVVGAVINGVPSNRMATKQQLVAGIDVPVFGILPQDRTLMGLSVQEVSQAAGAGQVTLADGGGELVENVMVGAAVLDHGPLYFGRKTNKAVLVRGERPDMQLAALETPTKVLVLTGGVKPIDQVAKQARRRKVPIVVTQRDTESALASVAEATQVAAFTHRQKLAKLDEILAGNFDFKALYKAIGI